MVLDSGSMSDGRGARNPSTCVDKNATTLDFSDRGLTSIPPEIFELKHLTHLDLSRNRLSTIPEEISKLSNLTSLKLKTNRFKEFPPALATLPNLAYLDLSENKMTDISPNIELKSITALNLSKNKLRDNNLPLIFELTSLIDLDVGQNEIESLPASVERLENLVKLDLGGNGLSALPTEISNLNYLTYLDLRGNNLVDLPNELNRLSELASLDLRGNKLHELPRILSQLTNLEDIHIDHRDIARFSSSIEEGAATTRDATVAENIVEERQEDDSSYSMKKDLFLSHSSEDKSLAILIAKELEHHGYTIWYYERDRIPIRSHLEVTGEAIAKCKATLILITHHSIASPEVKKEIERAHQERKALIPVRYAISHDDFQKRAPLIRQAIGTGVEIEVNMDKIEDAIKDIITGLKQECILPKIN